MMTVEVAIELGRVIYGHEILDSGHSGFQIILLHVFEILKLIQIKLILGHFC